MQRHFVQDCVWIGLVSLAGPKENPILQGGLGAYSNFLSRVRDKNEFVQRVTSESRKLGLEVEQLLWCEPLESRLARYEIDPDLLELAEQIGAEGGGAFGKFHAWDQE
jgi:hypothetical protein